VRAALITGSSEGLGLALALALCARGYGVTLTARGEDGLDAAARELRSRGADVETIAGDLGDLDHVHAVFEAHRSHFGRLDVLVNNVGTGFGEPIADITRKRLDLQLGLNVRTAIACTQEATSMLLASAAEHRQSWIVNVCSRAAVIPQPWLSVYSATKAALVAFSRATNDELVDRGVRACAICPGTVATALTTATPDCDGRQLITGEDVAGVLALLLDLSPVAELTQVVIDSRYDHAWRPPELPAR
jgi:NAD(P)-dependent dehydrogenase (short-subunit alcohol dehydrogenase family)